jgi:hypothetical protein
MSDIGYIEDLNPTDSLLDSYRYLVNHLLCHGPLPVAETELAIRDFDRQDAPGVAILRLILTDQVEAMEAFHDPR